jgi:hypothetical protein
MPPPTLDAQTVTINVRFEPDHPLLPAATWHRAWRSSTRGPHTRAIFILSPTGLVNADEDASRAARRQEPVHLNFDQQCDELWDKCFLCPDGFIWSLNVIAGIVADAELIVVGVEQLSDAALSFDPPFTSLPWEQRRALLEERFVRVDDLYNTLDEDTGETIPRCPGTELPVPRFLTVAEYRAEVGERVWQLETCEPLGPWSTAIPALP